MSWNFRVVKRGESFAIHYAYYDDVGKLISLSDVSVSPTCEDSEDLQETLKFMLEACEDTVVDFESLQPIKEL